MEDLTKKKCIPCEGGVEKIGAEQANKILNKLLSGWKLVDDMKITKDFHFPTYRQCIDFVNKLADLSEDEGHHPVIQIFFNRVVVDFWTHAILGLSENDFIMAAKTDEL